MVIQLHRELADRAREAFGHVLDATDRLVREPGRDDSRFIDAGSDLLAGKRMRAELELPIQDMIEAVHGAILGHTPQPRLRASVGVCQWYAVSRFTGMSGARHPEKPHIELDEVENLVLIPAAINWRSGR